MSDKRLHYKTILGYYRRWCKENVWKICWNVFLSLNKSKINLSSSDLDGSHTIALRGGEEVGYQGRNKRNKNNGLYFTYKQGLPLAMSKPSSGTHHDLYDIELHFDEIINTLPLATISVDGLFMNADAGFHAENLRRICQQKEIIANMARNKRNSDGDNEFYFDQQLYKERYSIERTNAWMDKMDSFRAVLNRFDTKLSSWVAFNYLAFINLACMKFKKSRSTQ